MDFNPHINYFAQTDFRGRKQVFGIKSEDRMRHMYVIGKTGMGKSTMLENLAIQDIKNGAGLAFVDPHGSSADTLLDFVPQDRIKDVIYIAPFDTSYPIAFNVMEDVGPDGRHLVVSGLMSAFKKIWVDAWSARMEYILTNILLALLEYPDSTLLGVNRMIADKKYREKVVANITDPGVKSFWVDEYAKYTDRFTAEATPAIQNKVGQFTANPLIRNIIGQPKSSFDFRQAMDDKKILIINLSKGRVGEMNTNLLGSMIITKLYLAAMSRATLSSMELKQAPPFYLYVDEFQSFANESFADILAEARKYKLALILAHQYVEQMSEEVRDAVFGNVGTTVAFRVGPLDAELLEKLFFPTFTKEDLVALGFAQIYLSLMIDGVGSPPFSATTLPSIVNTENSFKDEIIAQSRKTYASTRDLTETGINTWMSGEQPPNSKESPAESKNPSPKRKDKPKPKPEEPKKPKQQFSSKKKEDKPQETVSLKDLQTKNKEKDKTKNKTANSEHRQQLREALSELMAEEKTETVKETPAEIKSEEKKDKPAETPVAEKDNNSPKKEEQVNSKPPEVPEELLKKMLADDGEK
ncbi:MAG: type IV secretion system DNA-binding domain-containing protein [Patescibacteria group bacterium]